MIRLLFPKLAFCVILIIGFSCSFAFAEEVSLVPSDTFELYSTSNYQPDLVQSVKRSTSLYPFTESTYENGSTSLVPDSYYLYSSSGSTGHYLDPVQSSYGASAGIWSMSFDNFIVTLDMSENINGYYRYSFDLYFGISGGFDQWASFSARTLDFTPNYSYVSAPLFISDSDSGMHCTVYLVGQTDYTIQDDYADTGILETYSLIHIYVESTFYYDSSYGSEIVFNLEPWFDSNISSLSVDASIIPVNRSFYFYANNRVKSTLVGNVDPPVTPTPTPTPYPGQDTQESINQGVQTIIQGLDLNATPIPTPVDFSIDETFFDSLDEMTLPDLSFAESTYLSLWDIFDPLWPFICILVASLFVVTVFCWILRGGFI